MMITSEHKLKITFHLWQKNNRKKKKNNARFEADYALNGRIHHSLSFLETVEIYFLLLVTIFHQIVYKCTNGILPLKLIGMNVTEMVHECDCLYLKSIKHHMAASGTQHWITIAIRFSTIQPNCWFGWWAGVRLYGCESESRAKHMGERAERTSKLGDRVELGVFVCNG